MCVGARAYLWCACGVFEEGKGGHVRGASAGGARWTQGSAEGGGAAVWNWSVKQGLDAWSMGQEDEHRRCMICMAQYGAVQRRTPRHSTPSTQDGAVQRRTTWHSTPPA